MNLKKINYSGNKTGLYLLYEIDKYRVFKVTKHYIIILFNRFLELNKNLIRNILEKKVYHTRARSQL